jgi:hypothetical protein
MGYGLPVASCGLGAGVSASDVPASLKKALNPQPVTRSPQILHVNRSDRCLSKVNELMPRKEDRL